MARISKELPQGRGEWSFGDLLYWHLFVYGSTPGGDPTASAGRIWTQQRVWGRLNIHERTLRNWINDRNLPEDTSDIETLIFGEDRAFDMWRAELREALRRGRASKRPSRAPVADSLPDREEPLKLARIFLSYGRENVTEAHTLCRWLGDAGWDDVFVVSDEGISERTSRWERALIEAAYCCETVLFLISRAWLAAADFMREFALAQRLNKRLFCLLIEDIPATELPPRSTWQIISLVSGSDHVFLSPAFRADGVEKTTTFSASGLARLKSRLQRTGVDPRYFSWPPPHDPDRSPYRGLRPFEPEDAGIFFGREGPIVEVIDGLRGMRDRSSPRIVMVLGSSGAGKSSFLRAGLLPRVQRDADSYRVLPVIRPERDAINGDHGLLMALEAAFTTAGVPKTRATIREALQSETGELQGLLETLVRSSSGADAPGDNPSLLVSIDQAEELFGTEGTVEAAQLVEFLREVLHSDNPRTILIATMRSEFSDRFVNAFSLNRIAGYEPHPEIVTLLPIPRGSYQTVIEGPIAALNRAGRRFIVEPSLVQALLVDINDDDGHDALPLLAFTLERLFLDYGARGRLTASDYERLGRIRGSIEASIERALQACDRDSLIPRERAARLALIREAFIPWLAGIDPETKIPRPRVARENELPSASLPIIRHLIDQRLLATDVDHRTREITIQPSHEALLRQWSLLRGWLDDDLPLHVILESVRDAARNWETSDYTDAWLIHRNGRLIEAETLARRPDLASRLKSMEVRYLSACRRFQDDERAAEGHRLARERRYLRSARWALVSLALIVMAGFAGIAYGLFSVSKREAAALASEAETWFRAGYCDRALRFAMAGLPPTRGASPLDYRSEMLEGALSTYATARDCPFRQALIGHEAAVFSAEFSPDGRQAVTTSFDGTVKIWDVASGRAIETLKHESGLPSATYSPDGLRLLTTSSKTAWLWGLSSDRPPVALEGHDGEIDIARFSFDGRVIATASTQGHMVRRWDGISGSPLKALELKGQITSIDFDSKLRRIVTGFEDGTAIIWDGESGERLHILAAHKKRVRSVKFSPQGDRIVTVSEDHFAMVWDTASGKQMAALRGHTTFITAAAFSPDGYLILTTSNDGTARIWSSASGNAIATLAGHSASLDGAAFTPDGASALTYSRDGSAVVWNIETLQPIARLVGHDEAIMTAKFGPDSHSVITASADGTARIWNARSAMPLLTLPHLGQVYSAAFSGDGKRIVTAAQDGIARIWNAETGNLMRDLIGHSELLYGASFDHNGKRVVTASADKTARIWDTQTASLLFTLPHDDAVKLARYNSPADKIVTESGGTIRMWDAATGTLLWSQPEEDTVIDARFSLDGERVVTGSASGLVSVRDAKTGQLIKIIHPAQRESVQRISLSPDATRFFTATQDLSVEAFDTETGKRTALLSLTYGGGIPVLFGSTDGGVRAASQNRAHSLVAAALWDDGTARVWDTTSGALLAILSRHEGPATSVEFSPEGGYVVTAGLDNTARVWRLDPIIFMPAKQRREYLCRTRLLGIERLTPKERANPVIQGQSSRWNGCERHGWFSLAFYAHALNAILAKVGIELPLPNKPTLAHPLGDKKRNLLMSIEDLAWHLPSLYLLRDSARVE